MVALVATIFIVVVAVLAYLPGHVRTCRTDRVSVAITLYAEYPVSGRLQQGVGGRLGFQPGATI
jgi:hypothetical protein